MSILKCSLHIATWSGNDFIFRGVFNHKRKRAYSAAVVMLSVQILRSSPVANTRSFVYISVWYPSVPTSAQRSQWDTYLKQLFNASILVVEPPATCMGSWCLALWVTLPYLMRAKWQLFRSRCRVHTSSEQRRNPHATIDYMRRTV